jgi:hypothetical protein
MKRLLIAVFLLILALNLSAQDSTKNTFGISVNLGRTEVFRGFGKSDGGSGIEGSSSFDIGLNYFKPTTRTLTFVSGLFWHHNKITVTPEFIPVVATPPKYYNSNLLYIPINERLTILKYFFIEGGVLLDLDMSINSQLNNQTGIGSNIGLGLEIPVFKHHKVSISPYLNVHSIFQLTHDHNHSFGNLIDSGFRITIR